MLARAAELGTLKPAHFAGILAHPDYDHLQSLRKHGQIVLAATQRHLSSEEQAFAEQLTAALEVAVAGGGAEDLSVAVADLKPPQTPDEYWHLPFYAVCPVYCWWMGENGCYLGSSFHGYQLLAPTCAAYKPQLPEPESLDCAVAAPKPPPASISWTASAKDVMHIFQRGPPMMHLGLRCFDGEPYGLTLMAQGHEAVGDEVFYRVAVKRLRPLAQARAVLIGIEGQLRMHHDFSHHIYVSPLLPVPRNGLQKLPEDFTLSVSLSSF